MTNGSQTSEQASAHAGLRDDLKQDAGRLKHSVTARVHDEAETRKGQAVHVAGTATSAINSAVENLRDNPDAPDWMASALQQAARRIENAANHIEGRNIDELGSDVAQFARQNPAAFLAASAAAGFAAARVLRAGIDKKRHGDDAAYTAQQSSDDGFSQYGQTGSGDQQWPADENVMPTSGTGDFEPAYGQSRSDDGGVVR